MSWDAIKSAVNSTVGTGKFKPLDKIIVDEIGSVKRKIEDDLSSGIIVPAYSKNLYQNWINSISTGGEIFIDVNENSLLDASLCALSFDTYYNQNKKGVCVLIDRNRDISSFSVFGNFLVFGLGDVGSVTVKNIFGDYIKDYNGSGRDKIVFYGDKQDGTQPFLIETYNIKLQRIV